MIRLFDSTASSFDTLGLGNLSNAMTCEVTEERNGEFELEMQYPIDGVHYDEIKLRNLIVCKSTPYSTNQAFRIYYISKPINGIVTVKAAHISYDLSGITVNPYTAEGPAKALEGIKTNASTDCPFTFAAKKEGTNTYEVKVPSSARSLLGGNENSILDVFGKGEYEFDNYQITLHTNRGSDTGVTLRYGKNLTDLKQEENCENVYTGVYPYWLGTITEYDKDGKSQSVEKLVTLTEKIVNVEGTFNFVRTMPLDLSSELETIKTETTTTTKDEDGNETTTTSETETPPTEDDIRERTKKYIEDNELGKPKVSLTVSFVQLEQAEEYETLRLLEKVSLCDTVSVYFPKLNVDSTAKCIKTVYNAITDKYTSIELGESSTNLSSTLANTEKTLEEIPTMGFMDKAISRATSLITGGLGGYVILHSSTGADTPDELLILEPESKGDYLKAQRIWRWNYQGLGYSENGYNGTFGLAMTIDGEISANFVNTGQLKVGGTGQANSIEVYDTSGNNKLVWFDNTGINLAAGQKIKWANITGVPDYQTKSQLDAATNNLYSNIQTLYYAVKMDGFTGIAPAIPSKPTSKVTESRKVFGIWTLTCPDADLTPETRTDWVWVSTPGEKHFTHDDSSPWCFVYDDSYDWVFIEDDTYPYDETAKKKGHWEKGYWDHGYYAEGYWTKRDNTYRYNTYFFSCNQCTKRNGAVTWTNVIQIDNSQATTVLTKNSVTTSYVNALNIVAQDIQADRAIMGPTIYGGTYLGKTTDYTAAEKAAGVGLLELKSYAGSVLNWGDHGNVDIPFRNASLQIITRDTTDNSCYTDGFMVRKKGSHKSMFMTVNAIESQRNDSPNYPTQTEEEGGWDSWWAVFQQSSDKRLKKDIKTADKSKIRKLFQSINFSSFKYKSDKDGVTNHGVIAQELIPLLNENGFDRRNYITTKKPTGSNDTYLHVEYQELDKLGLIAIQDLYNLVNKQQEEINELKETINKIKME